MKKSKKITLHPVLSDGSVDTSVNLYPKTNNIVDEEGNPIEVATQSTLNLKEDKSNKVISISSSSTNNQYPSAKCVYDNLNGKASAWVDSHFINAEGDITLWTSAMKKGDIIVDISEGFVGIIHQIDFDNNDNLLYVNVQGIQSATPIRYSYEADEEEWHHEDAPIGTKLYKHHIQLTEAGDYIDFVADKTLNQIGYPNDLKEAFKKSINVYYSFTNNGSIKDSGVVLNLKVSGWKVTVVTIQDSGTIIKDEVNINVDLLIDETEEL